MKNTSEQDDENVEESLAEDQENSDSEVLDASRVTSEAAADETVRIGSKGDH